jgi:hypothetical protein
MGTRISAKRRRSGERRATSLFRLQIFLLERREEEKVDDRGYIYISRVLNQLASGVGPVANIASDH